MSIKLLKHAAQRVFGKNFARVGRKRKGVHQRAAHGMCRNLLMKQGIALMVSLLQFSPVLHAQTKTNLHKAQLWLGYMSSARIGKKISLWNDAHYASDNFIIGRHGLSYHFNNQVIVTGGYAWLFLSTSFSDRLARAEHRPWGQALFVSSIGSAWQVHQRIRYDARFRQTIEDGAIGDGYTFNHRLRYMFSIRRSLDGKILGNRQPFVSMNNEVLINFGKNIYQNNLDQFRATLMAGYTLDNLTFQFGYMYRYVPLAAPYTYRHFHGITLWVNQQFKTKWQQDNLIRSK